MLQLMLTYDVNSGFSLQQHVCNLGCSLFVREADEETKGERNGGRIREYEEQIKSGQAATMTRVRLSLLAMRGRCIFFFIFFLRTLRAFARPWLKGAARTMFRRSFSTTDSLRIIPAIPILYAYSRREHKDT